MNYHFVRSREKDTWNLKPMFESDAAWNEEYSAIEKQLEEVASYQGTLGKSL
ncbi:hypothetical protein MGH68_05450 [Erysipelothrix sp. D19-032]